MVNIKIEIKVITVAKIAAAKVDERRGME